MADTLLPRRTLLRAAAALPFATLSVRAAGAERIGGIDRFLPALDAVIDRAAPIEVIGRGYGWAEGPVWDAPRRQLLFSDVPGNRMWRWRPGRGMDLFLDPSGHSRPVPAAFREAGTNGGAVARDGALIYADCGNRAVVRIDPATKRRTVLAERFDGRRFNSPNDVAVGAGGAIYFTDPPYGLADGDTSPLRELAFNGVYRLAPDGTVALIDAAHRRPNGIGLSPDGSTLYLSLSDEKRPELLAYPLGRDGLPDGPARLLHDFRAGHARGEPGLPDGMEVSPNGLIFASGPGGIHVLDHRGVALGLIRTGRPIANCTIGEGGRALFLTSADIVTRVALRPGATRRG